jgi:hypothetical protein
VSPDGCIIITALYVRTATEILLSVGDLDDFPQEISDLFVQCFSQLTVQVGLITCRST